MKASFARLINRDAIFVTLLATLAAAVAVVVITSVSGPAPLIVMDLRTEVLTQRVARPELSAFPVVEAQIAQPGECAAWLNGAPFTGLVRPPEGAAVTYSWQPENLQIEIRAPAGSGGAYAPTLLANSDEDECSLAMQRVLLRVAPPTSLDHAWQLPVAGPAQAGSEFGAVLAPRPGSRRAFDLLREGRVDVFGKSVFGHALFPAPGASYVVPAGSRIASPDTIEPGTGPAEASWYGIAFYESDGLHVSATTETKELRLFRPGATNQSEVFGLGLLASVLGDPALGTTAFAIAVFGTVLGILTGWMGLHERPDGPPKPAPRPANPPRKPVKPKGSANAR